MIFTDTFLDAMTDAADAFHDNAVRHGFWQEVTEMRARLPEEMRDRFDSLVMAEKLALLHSELSEALEAVRKADWTSPDHHCPEFTNLEVELADTFIRLLETSRRFGLRLGEAVLAKHAYNTTRPYLHSKRF